MTAQAGERMRRGGWKEEDGVRNGKDGVGGQKMRDGIERVLKEGGNGIGLWIVTPWEETVRTGGR